MSSSDRYPEATADVRRGLFTTMVRIRAFEEKANELFRSGLTPGRMHSCRGEEAIAAGACSALLPQDLVVSTHRGGGHLIAKGADMRRLVAEYMGRATGYANGKGGPMHLSIPELGFLCTTGIVGNGVPVAVGAAFAVRRAKREGIVVCFYGDGAANTGACHEGQNLAAIWKLPVVFICENNQYAETMPMTKAFAIDRIARRAEAYGFPGTTVDGNDVELVRAAVLGASARARNGEGPTLVEAVTYRADPHFSGESEHYIDRTARAEWLKKDPIDRYRKRLIEEWAFDADELRAVESAAVKEAEQAAEQAMRDPDPSKELLMRDVYEAALELTR